MILLLKIKHAIVCNVLIHIHAIAFLLRRLLTKVLSYNIINCVVVLFHSYLFHSSSVVEQSAVNRSVVGSNPTCGA